jgi:hypothetical protein
LVPHLLHSWNLKAQHCIHRSNPPLDPVLSQMKSVHIMTLCIFKIHINIILLFISMSSKWSVPCILHSQTISSSSCLSYMEKSSHYEAAYFAVFSVIMLLPVLGPNILWSTLFLDARILNSSLKVRDTKFYSYCTAGC